MQVQFAALLLGSEGQQSDFISFFKIEEQQLHLSLLELEKRT